jgi:hypothetical protein
MSSESSYQIELRWSPKVIAIIVLALALLALLGISLARPNYAEPLFIHACYYFLLVTVVCWVIAHAYAARGTGWRDVVAWVKDNRAGIVIAFAVTVIAALAIQPALRVLSDEANLLGTSRSLFLTKTATFTTTGKYYYDNFWDQSVVIDRRPSLFPFLVSLVHILRGYNYRNVFLFNLAMLPVFVLVAYRLAKTLGGELVGIVTALLVVAHPITLISMRSGGFDFFTAAFALVVAKSFLDHSRDPSPERLLVLWMNLCVFAEIRYETVLFLPPVTILLLVFRLARWEYIRPFTLLYALTPAYLLPRIWQSILRGNVPEQDAGAVTFSLNNFLENSRDYFKIMLSPFDFRPPHSAVVIALGIVGCVMGLLWCRRQLLARERKQPGLKFATLVIVWMVVQVAIVFTYVWGRPNHPASARLLIAIDTFFSFPAAYALALLLKRWRPFVAVVAAAGLLAVYLPVASEFRFLNELTLTREAATCWRFFEGLHEKRILVVAERPGLYTIMEYGASDFESARNDAGLLDGFSRHLFYDVYLVQQIDLTTRKAVPQNEIWPERSRTPMLEFQNDQNATIRISRLDH